MFVNFHIAVGLRWCDVMCVCVCVSMCVNKKDVKNESREIIIENNLWCKNVVLLIVHQNMLGMNGRLLFLSLKEKVFVKYRSNS